MELYEFSGKEMWRLIRTVLFCLIVVAILSFALYSSADMSRVESECEFYGAQDYKSSLFGEDVCVFIIEVPLPQLEKDGQ